MIFLKRCILLLSECDWQAVSQSSTWHELDSIALFILLVETFKGYHSVAVPHQPQEKFHFIVLNLKFKTQQQENNNYMAVIQNGRHPRTSSVHKYRVCVALLFIQICLFHTFILKTPIWHSTGGISWAVVELESEVTAPRCMRMSLTVCVHP